MAPICTYCKVEFIEMDDNQYCCPSCGALSAQLSQKLTDERDGDLEGAAGTRRAGRWELLEERAKKYLESVESSFAWPRGEALRYSAQLFLKLLLDLGVDANVDRAFKVVWNMFAKHANLDGCCTEGDRYIDGTWVTDLEPRRLNDAAIDKLYTSAVQNMHLTKVVELLYISVMVCGDQSMEYYDMFRWIREGHLPGTLLSRYFPRRVRLHKRDMFRFTCASVKPIPPGFVYVTGAYMGLTRFPRRDVLKIVKRLMVEMQLPLALFDVVVDLHSKLPVNDAPSFQNISRSQRERMEYRSIKFIYNASRDRYPELRAAAFLMVALKLVFSLNDDSERRLSVWARKLKEIGDNCDDPTECVQKHLRDVFVFSEWFDYITYRDVIVKKLDPSNALSSSSDRILEKTSVAALLRRSHIITEQAFIGQQEKKRSYIKGVPKHRMYEKDRESIAAVINHDKTGEIQRDFSREISSVFRPSHFPQLNMITAYLAIFPSIQKLRRTPANRHVKLEEFAENLNVDLLKRRFTPLSLRYVSDPLFGELGNPDYGSFPPEARRVCSMLRKDRSTRRASYWVLSIRGVRNRHDESILREKLPSNFYALMQVFADAISSDFVELFDEIEVVESTCLKDRLGYRMGHISCRSTRMDGVKQFN